MFRGKVRTIHFVGIGGIGMSGIAEVQLSSGFDVQGTDRSDGTAVARLRHLGARVFIGHSADVLGDADVVVRSSAVPVENPEVVAALSRGTPVINRAEMLAELMRLKYGIALAGSHGKTTTTTMVATILHAGGLDPTTVVGGRVDAFGGANAMRGGGEYLVAEADESDGTFLQLSPTVALVTNIDLEHLDHHGDIDRLEQAFVDFVNKVPFYGFAALCIDHPRVAALVGRVRKRVVTYGLSRPADVRATDLVVDGFRTRFVAWHGDVRLGEVDLGVPGKHNVQNAVGALAIALELQVPFDVAAKALAGFQGVQRRFTRVAEVGGVLVIDDYAHHPTEIEATLEAAEAALPGRRLVALFQPHRASRVSDLWTEFATCLHRADRVVVLPIYLAGEMPRDGIDAPSLAAAMRERGHRQVTASVHANAAIETLRATLMPGDVVIGLGAGDITRTIRQLAAELGA